MNKESERAGNTPADHGAQLAKGVLLVVAAVPAAIAGLVVGGDPGAALLAMAAVLALAGAWVYRRHFPRAPLSSASHPEKASEPRRQEGAEYERQWDKKTR